MVVSSRDRIRQRRLMALVRDHRQDAAACVSLSKSTMSKIERPSGRTRRNRRRRGRRVSIRLGISCQPLCEAIFEGPKRPETERKNHLRGRRVKPHQSVGDSIEGAEVGAFAKENQALSNSFFRRRRQPRPARTGGGFYRGARRHASVMTRISWLRLWTNDRTGPRAAGVQLAM